MNTNKERYLKSLNLLTALVELPDGQGWVWDMINNILTEVLNSVTEERLAIKQRQREGIDAAKKEGKHLGRVPIQYPDNWNEYYDLWKDKKISAQEFMSATNLKRTTFYRLVKKFKEEN